MAGQEFGAFISYRRGETDEIVARALHRLLEGYLVAATVGPSRVREPDRPCVSGYG